MPRKKKVDSPEKESGLPLLIDPSQIQQIQQALIHQDPVPGSSATMMLPPGMMVLTEEMMAEEEEDEEDNSPSWEVTIEGLQSLTATGMKFPVFTPGETSSGQVVFEFLSGKGVNATIFGWLRNPKERTITLKVSDKETEEVFETWTMKAMPVAIALDELDSESTDAWHTTFQVSVKDIQIT